SLRDCWRVGRAQIVYGIGWRNCLPEHRLPLRLEHAAARPVVVGARAHDVPEVPSAPGTGDVQLERHPRGNEEGAPGDPMTSEMALMSSRGAAATTPRPAPEPIVWMLVDVGWTGLNGGCIAMGNAHDVAADVITAVHPVCDAVLP